MGFRQFDWECVVCHDIHTLLVWMPHGEIIDTATEECPVCGAETPHERMISAPARYTYDLPYEPMVKGGRFDTAGHRKPPPLPELPKDASMDQARDFFSSQQHRESVKERMEVHQQNAAKRARAEAMKKHPTMDIRNTPLPGDPPVERVGKGTIKSAGKKQRGTARKIRI